MVRLRAPLSISLAATALLAFAAAAQPFALSTEFLRIKTADGVETAGLLYAPVGRAPRGGVVLVHGYGSNFYSGSTGHLSRALAEHGFMTIAINMRDHDAGPKTTLFEENRLDEQAAVEELARRGVAPLAIVGSSLGTNGVLFYVAETHDPRVRAVVLLAGPGNAFEWNVRRLGRERAMETLQEAQRLQAAGRGKELMLVDLGPLGKALYSADHLVSLRGPQTKSDPFKNIARVTGPVLLVYGTADRLVESEIGRRLKAAATKAPRADLIEIAGADHDFSTHRDELASTVERWLREVLGR
jgi:pimeloyl-ACP methyl ester carboxylesterase